MLFRYINYIDTPSLFIQLISMFIVTGGISLLICITVHEFSHAVVAEKFGDSTPRRQGRISLNPIAHLDPIGTIMLFLVGLGWGKPVVVNDQLFGRNPAKKMALVAIAGPLSNMVTAAIFSMPIQLGLIVWESNSHSPLKVLRTGFINFEDFMATLLGFFLFFNIILALFNLIPLAPLDGSKILKWLIPKRLSYPYMKLEPYGPVVLIGIIGLSWFANVHLIWEILGPALNFFAYLLIQQPFY